MAEGKKPEKENSEILTHLLSSPLITVNKILLLRFLPPLTVSGRTSYRFNGSSLRIIEELNKDSKGFSSPVFQKKTLP